MTRTSARRLFAAAGVTAALILVGGGPAVATAPGATVGVYFRDRTLAAPGPGIADSAIIFASEPAVFDNVVVTYDFSDIADFIDVAEDGPFGRCSAPAAGVLSCPEPVDVSVDEFGLRLSSMIVIEPTGAATQGDEGTLTVTLEADGYAPVSHEARIRIGSSVDLAGGGSGEREAAPGEFFTATLRVTNVGGTPADGAVIVFFDDFALRTTQEFSNCTYDDGNPRACQFHTELKAGSTYQASFPYALRTDTYAPSTVGSEHVWMTPAEYEDYLGHLARFGVEAGDPGGGGVLELVEAATLSGQGLQADVDPSDNWTSTLINVTGVNGTDLAAVGDILTGAAGEVVTASVGLKNNGPATLDSGRWGYGITVVHVTVPPGTTAVEVPRQCLPETDDGVDGENPGMPGAPKYVCGTGFLSVAGETETIEVKLRIDAVIPDATGTVSVLEPCECPGFPPEHDLDNSNNQAKIIVNPTSRGGGTGGHGLANTGAKTGLIATAGGLLLVAGSLAVIFVWRRRLRITA